MKGERHSCWWVVDVDSQVLDLRVTRWRDQTAERPSWLLWPEFWGALDRTECTAFAGVLCIYKILHRLYVDPKRHPSWRTMTQASGGLRHDLIQSLYERTRAARCRFVVMCGQTEVTACNSYVSFDDGTQRSSHPAAPFQMAT